MRKLWEKTLLNLKNPNIVLSFKEIEVNGQKIAVCADHPVEQVSYDDAIEFAGRMNELDPGHTYSLPTEAQLEVAFRGGTKSAYVTGKDDKEGLGDYVWHSDNSNRQTHGVKSKQANKYGIYRSVLEWAKDWYGANYADFTGLDPQGPATGFRRVTHGSSWNYWAGYHRSASRGSLPPGYRSANLGFRLVRT
jgi:formylglycine-generating enzyme required for sulfatase activity